MACNSFYEVLQVPRQATLDEIKLAFRRRALQVHPDKGGSKEAFHRVYQALETLSDPEARKKYDERLSSLTPSKGSKGTRQASADRGEAEKAQPEQTSTAGASAKSPGPETFGSVPKNQYIFRPKTMKRIRTLLQQLPRDLRFQVISQDFSQKQRVLFQRWMDDIGAEKQATRGVPAAVATPRRSNLKRGPSRKEVVDRLKRHKQGRGYRNYRVSVHFNRLKLETSCRDLPTALEYLLVLTSAKQKALDPSNDQGAFEDRVEKALVSSAAEQGRALHELNLCFIVAQSAAIFLGRRFVHGPRVRTLAEVKKLRKCMEPFQGWGKHYRGLYCIFEHFSPMQLQGLWEQFQSAVAAMFQAVGADVEPPMQKIRSWYNAAARLRTKHLQLWESRHMAKEDKKRTYRTRDESEADLKTLKELLARWAKSLTFEAQKQQMRIHREQKRARLAIRKELSERMKDPNLTMDDILGPKKKKVATGDFVTCLRLAKFDIGSQDQLLKTQEICIRLSMPQAD
eukprot:Skav200063  [mRNA]  locus=scaffold838:66270:67805:+ [translate_table: standard]